MNTPNTPIKTKLRILMVAACPFPWPRGTPVRIERLSEALVKQGHSVDVVTYHLGKETDHHDFRVFRTRNIRYYTKVSAGPSLTKLLVLNPLLASKILKASKLHQYDVVHAHHIEGLLSARIARRFGLNLPIVYDAHTLIESELPDYGPKFGQSIKASLGGMLDHWLPKGADSVIAVTESIRSALLSNDTHQAHKVSVIPNGIEDDFIERAEAQSTSNPIETSAAKGLRPYQFLFAGNMASYQGIDLMLESFAKLLSVEPNAVLSIITDEPFDAYEDLANTLGIRKKISIQSVSLEQLPIVISSADVLLNPRTICAGIPQKLLNYMACAKPIVSYEGSAKIAINRVHALVVENGDVSAFSDAMIELINDPAMGRKLSENAFKLIHENYSWDNTATNTIRVYEDTIASHPKQAT